MLRFGLLTLLLSLGCVSFETKPDQGEKGEAAITGHFVYQEGAKKKFPNPLPDMVSLILKWEEGDQSVLSDKRIRGWDFDKDGFVDMVEVLDHQGSYESFHFDFNADGKIDLSRLRSDEK